MSLPSSSTDHIVPPTQEQLNLKSRSNILAWKGQFTPQLVETLVKTYGHAGAVVFDPFMGSGTVIGECARLNLSVYASDINPAAVTLSRIYLLCQYDADYRKSTLDNLDPIVNKLISDTTETIHTLPLSELERSIVDIFLCQVDTKTDRMSWIKIWSSLKKLIISLPRSSSQIRLTMEDARKVSLPDNTIDLVITSPPYLNVINYHQQHRGVMEKSGWNILQLAKSEIGSNRKNRGNRFLTVIQYCLDMAMVLQEIKRVCKLDGRVIIVVGKTSTIRGVSFDNSLIITKLATECVGFRLIETQTRCFKNRFGKIIYEDILHFRGSSQTVVGSARSVAKMSLMTSMEAAPDDLKPEIERAIAQADTLKPSPFSEQLIK